MRLITTLALATLVAGCATPYQEMGLLGGVQATRITGDTVQVTARGNAYTDADAIQRYALRKAAEATVAAGYDLFIVATDQDRTREGRTSTAYASGNWNSAWATGTSWQQFKPGQTLMIKLSKYPAPTPLPNGMFDAREVLSFIGSDVRSSADCKTVGDSVKCDRSPPSPQPPR